MTKKVAVTLILICSFLAAVMGAAGGAEYVMRRVDALDAARATQQSKLDADRESRSKQYADAAVNLSQQLFACQDQFQESTVIYERGPQIPFGLSIGGLQVQPAPAGFQGNGSPHWLIPAKVKPVVLGDPRGAVYYYMSRENRMDGPYLPEAVTGTGR